MDNNGNNYFNNQDNNQNNSYNEGGPYKNDENQNQGGPYSYDNNANNANNGGPYMGAGYGQAPVKTYSTGLGIASLVLGIASLALFYTGILSLPSGILAIVLGAFQLKKNREFNHNENGISYAGIVTGIVGLVLTVVFWFLIIAGIFRSGLIDAFKNTDANTIYNEGINPFDFEDDYLDEDGQLDLDKLLEEYDND